jgi:hypothetical protein
VTPAEAWGGRRGQYRPQSGRVSLGCGCGRARPADRRGGQAVARVARRSRPSQCRKRAEHDVAAPAAWLCAHAVRGLNERDGWLSAGLGAATTVRGSSSMPDAWVDRPGTGNRLGGERAVGPPGRPKQAASAAGWACTSSSSGAAFTPLAVVLRARATSIPPLYEHAPDIREACLGADLPDTEQSRRHLAAVDATLQGEQHRRELLPGWPQRLNVLDSPRKL